MDASTRSPSGALLPFLGKGSPTKIDYRKKGTLSLTPLLQNLVKDFFSHHRMTTTPFGLLTRFEAFVPRHPHCGISGDPEDGHPEREWLRTPD